MHVTENGTTVALLVTRLLVRYDAQKVVLHVVNTTKKVSFCARDIFFFLNFWDSRAFRRSEMDTKDVH